MPSTEHDRAQAKGGTTATAPAPPLLATCETTHFLGVGYLEALENEIGRPILVDCGDEAGLVLAALRTGLKRLVFTGAPAVQAKLQAIAAAMGAAIYDGEALEHEPGDRLPDGPFTRARWRDLL